MTFLIKEMSLFNANIFCSIVLSFIMGEMLLICREMNRNFASSKEELCYSNAIVFTDSAIYWIKVNLPEDSSVVVNLYQMKDFHSSYTTCVSHI